MSKFILVIPKNLQLFTSFHLFLFNCQLNLDSQTCQVAYGGNPDHNRSQLNQSQKQPKLATDKILVQFNNNRREIVEIGNLNFPIQPNDVVTLLMGKRYSKDHEHEYDACIAIYSHTMNRYAIINRNWPQLFYSFPRKILGFCWCFVLLLIIVEIVKNSLLSFGLFFLPGWLWAIWAVNTEIIKFRLMRHIKNIYSQGKIHSSSPTTKVLSF